MRIVRGDGSDRATTQACFEVVRAACEVDDPHGPPWSLTRVRGWIEHPTDPNELWIAADEATGAAWAGTGWCCPSGRTGTGGISGSTWLKPSDDPKGNAS